MKILKHSISKRLLISLLSLVSMTAFGQFNPAYYTESDQKSTAATLGASPNPVLQVNSDKTLNGQNTLRETDVSAKLYLKLDLGDDYINLNNTSFGESVSLTVTSGSYSKNVSLTIDQDNPEAVKAVDLFSAVNAGNLGATVDVTVSYTSAGNPDALMADYIDKKIRVTATIVREYAVDVRLDPASQGAPALMSAPLTGLGCTISKRRATFNWTPANVDGYPNYEVQILRLYNEDPSTNNTNSYITSTVDWTRALRVETQSSQASIDLTIPEGTGYYIWRVRPVGNYFEGGIANHENYGQWSVHVAQGTEKTFFKSTMNGNGGFYFTDPDEDINWIYNRVFSEGDVRPDSPQGARTSESMTYADGLLRKRQTQKYNSQDQLTLVSQTVSDYSGRPALTTLPAPVTVSDGLEGYKVGFVKSGDGTLYTAENFDDDGNYDSPEPFASGTDMDYYSGTPTGNNANVADAEGFPYKRTLFKTDGTGRVSEKSGVGKTHALGTVGNSQDGDGRTTRILYGSPSDEELLRIFGDEAPLAESVIKTITIDPNDVVSVSYTSKEGETIATAMMTDEVSGRLDALSTNSETFTSKHAADQNIRKGQTLVSSKRIAISAAKQVEMDYKVVNDASMGGCPSADCNLYVRFYLKDISKGETYISDADGNDPGVQAFAVQQGSYFGTGTWSWENTVSGGSAGPSVSDANTDGVYNEFTLDAGEYIFIKEVYSINGENYLERQVTEYSDAIAEVMEALTDTMKTINNAGDYDDFDTYMNDLSDLISEYNGSGPATSDDIVAHLGMEVDNNYVFPTDFTLPSDPLQDDPNNSGQSTLTITATCCGDMSIPVPKPARCAPCEYIDANGDDFDGVDTIRNNSSDLSMGGTDWNSINSLVEDHFMGYLVETLKQEGFLASSATNPPQSTAATNFQMLLDTGLAPGFTYESMAFMLTNMLSSEYYTGKSKEDGGTWYKAKEKEDGTLGFVDDNGDFTTTPSEYVEVDQDNEFNYDCKELYQCWTHAVDMINSFGFDGGTNVMDGYNDQDGGNASEKHYDDDDSKEGGEGIDNSALDFIISMKMRKFNDSDDGNVPESKLNSLVSIPNIFMSCAGYQFQKVLDDDETLPTEYTSSITGNNPSIEDKIALHDNLGYGMGNSYNGHNMEAPVLIEEYGTNYPGSVSQESLTCVNVSTSCSLLAQSATLYYPYMLKPHWMFKYFRYNSHNEFNDAGTANGLADDDQILPTQIETELEVCYNKVDCGSIEPCFDEPCNYYHESWSAGQRLNFYKMIQGGKKCPCPDDMLTSDDTETPADPDKEVLVAKANMELNDAISLCELRESEIKSALLAELDSACYEVVECVSSGSPAYEISMDQVDLMVEAAIEECSTAVEDVRTKLPTCDQSGNCTGGTGAYGTGSGEYPKFTKTSCYYVDSYGQCQTNREKMELELFTDCDTQVLEQLQAWDFRANIGPPSTLRPDCSSVGDEEWVNNCNTYDGSPCPTADPDCTQGTNKYSEQFSVSSGQ